jgi:hypothetical protein
MSEQRRSQEEQVRIDFVLPGDIGMVTVSQ